LTFCSFYLKLYVENFMKFAKELVKNEGFNAQR
jgi:hypothetical protein